MSKIQYTTLREKPCGYNHSMIKRLRMLETTKGFISASDNKIDVYMYRDTLKIIDVNPSSLSFTDSFNGDTYEQTLSFEIPLINHQFYFHYNILEYINNRYYCIIETTDGKYIVGGYKSGMFPSYTIDENNITITLKTNATSNNTLIADYISFNEIEYNHCMGIDGECIDGLWTYKLIQRLNLDGSVSNEYYALNGYENDYTDINIVGTYSRFDTVFGIKLTNPLYDCFKQCYISGLPSFINFKKTGETQCFTIESDCDFTYSYDITVIDASFNEDTNELCVTSLKMDSVTQIKITTSDGIDRFVNVVIGTVGGEQGEYERQYRWFYNGETYCLDENQSINCISSVTIPNETITSGICKYHKTEEYISPLCDGKYDFYGYGFGDLISCERIYRWVLSDSELDYYCDYKTYTKYAMEVQEYSDDNGLTWIRTDNTRITNTVIEEYSEDCGYGSNASLIGECGSIPLNVKSSGTIKVKVYDEYPSNNKTYTFEYQNGSECKGVTYSSTSMSFNVDVVDMYSFEDYYGEYNELKNIPCSYLSEINMSEITPTHNNIDVTYKGIPYYAKTIKDPFGDQTTLSSFDVPNFFGINASEVDLGSIYEYTKESNSYGGYKCTNVFSTELDLTKWDLRHCKNFSLDLVSNGCDIDSDGCATKIGSVNFSDLKMNNIQSFGIYNGYGCDKYNSPNPDYRYEFDLSSFNVTNLTKLDLIGWNIKSVNLSNWKLNNQLSIAIDIHCPYEYRYNTAYQYTAYLPIDEIILNDASYYTYKLLKEDSTVSANTWTTNIDLSPKGTLSFTRNNSGSTYVYLNRNTYTISSATNNYSISMADVLDEPLYTLKYYNYSSGTSRSESFIPTDVTSITSFPDTSQIVDMSGMFKKCSGLTSLDLSSFDTSNVLCMDYMFERCSGLTSLNLSSFDTSNVKSMIKMFSQCRNLTSLNLSGWDVSNVSDFHDMFYNCKNLRQVTISDYRLELILLAEFGDTIEIIKTDNYLNECDGVIDIDCTKVSFKNNLNGSCYKSIMFEPSNEYYREHLTTLGTDKPSDISLSSLTNCNYIFSLPITIDNINIVPSGLIVANYSNTNYKAKELKGATCMILNENMSNYITSLTQAFSIVHYIDFNGFTAKNVTNMSQAFYSSNFTSLDLSNWNTSNVTNMKQMFWQSSNLTSLDLSNWNTSNVTNMSEMFDDCSGLTSLDLSSFNTSKVTSMFEMFWGCNNLLSLDLSNWNTSNVTNMSEMFERCNSLTTIKVTNCSSDTITKLQEALTDAGYSSTVANGIITVNH